MNIDDTDNLPPDAAVTRSEEELAVTTRWAPTRRVRIFKRITTVTETRTFELVREELVVEELDAGPAAGRSKRPEPVSAGLVLQREELVVSKRLVPYEHVTIRTDLITEQHTVSDTLRKERIEADSEIHDALTPPPGRTDHV